MDRPRRVADGNRFGLEHRTAAALRAEMLDIGSQAVADIDHGMEVNQLVELERFAHARCERKVFPQDAAAQGPRDQKPITWLRSGAAHGAAGRRFAEYGDADDERTIPAIGVAARDRCIEAIGDVAQSSIQILGDRTAVRAAEQRSPRRPRAGPPWRRYR